MDGPFSAVSRPTIAILDAFFSIFQNLHVVRSFAPLETQFFAKKNRLFFRAHRFKGIRENPEIYAEILQKKSAKFEIGAVQKNANLVGTFGFVFFFSPGAPKRLQTTHGPENAVSLLEK